MGDGGMGVKIPYQVAIACDANALTMFAFGLFPGLLTEKVKSAQVNDAVPFGVRDEPLAILRA